MYHSEFGRRLRTHSAGAGSSSPSSSRHQLQTAGDSSGRASRAHDRQHNLASISDLEIQPRRQSGHASSSRLVEGPDLGVQSSGMIGSSIATAVDDSGISNARSSATTSDHPGTPKRAKAKITGDRFIPARNGTDVTTAYQLGVHEAASKKRQKRKMAVDMDAQKEEADHTFSSLLTTELLGPGASDLVAGIHGAPFANGAGPSHRAGGTGQVTDHPAGPTTPKKKNLLTYSHTPSPSSSRSLGTPGRSGGSERVGVYSASAGGRSSSGLFGAASTSPTKRGQVASLDSPLHSAYSLSPVNLESQRMLLHPRKPARTLSKVAFKVLDAPDLANDFYLNLVDWSPLNVLAVALGQCVYLWSAKTSSVVKLVDLTDGDDRITGLNWSNNGKYLSVGTDQGEVQIWDVEHESRVRTMSGHQNRVGALAWNLGLLSTGSRDKVIYHRDTRVPEHWVAELKAHKQEVCGLKWNTTTNQLASGGNDNKLLVWDGMSTVPLHRFAEHTAAVKAIAWSPHQQGLLASGGGTADMRIRFWNTITGQMLSETDTGSQVCNLSWSKTANEIISTHGYSTGKVQNQIQVWKYPTMSQVATLTGHTMRVLYLSMSPDGESIVTGAGDETLRFWDLNTPTKTQLESRASSSSLDPFQKLR
ncbi:WD40 repeat-like protein [Ceraceosorus guamensis]|uniref:WD40 repeat-like protein n=1 Tax=Ceraceosorus guamensis TaxID=1522189 RepID=A0A316VS84_9BASI|nr:WD40 repeat-like protein [Ceraceosorus guamensis]PWN40074.1 WD40 repeat-like protein [Ceraceosorus guamensis]